MEDRFTLRPGRWYACEFIMDSFIGDPIGSASYRYTPIYVWAIDPTQSGKRTFRLKFFHANYPEGVQDKHYTLQTIERGGSLMIARSVDHQPFRILLIYELTVQWLRFHFPGIQTDTQDAQQAMNRLRPGVQRI